MMKKYVQFSVVIVFGSILFAQTPTVEWKKTYYDDVVQMASLSAIQARENGGFLMAGIGNFNILKTDSECVIEDFETYSNFHAESIKETLDGGFVIAGRQQNNGMIIKLDENMNIEWDNAYGGSDFDIIHQILVNADGSYTFVGQTYSPEISGYSDGSNAWLGFVDTEGDLIWEKAFGELGKTGFYDIVYGESGTFYACGVEFGATRDNLLVKFDFAGNIVWDVVLGGSNTDNYNSLIRNDAGNIVVVGESNSTDGAFASNHGNYDLVLATHRASDGQLLDLNLYGGSGYEYGKEIQLMEDGNYIIVSGTNSSDGDISTPVTDGYTDAWVVKISPSGQKIWDISVDYDEIGGSDAEIYSMSRSSDGAYVFVGSIVVNQGSNDTSFLFKLGGTMGVEEVSTNKFQVYPNPAKDIVHLQNIEFGSKIQIYDMSGKKVFTSTAQSETVQINISSLSKGVYVIEIQSKGKKSTRKLIVK